MRFVPVRHHSLGCHGSAYISIPYGWCLADARSSPISKFFTQRSPLDSKTLVGVANALKSFRIPKTRKIGYFLSRKVANNHDPVVGTPFENSLKITC